MGKLFPLLFLWAVVGSISFSLTVGDVKAWFPDGGIDFFFTPKSYAEYRGLRVPLKDYKLFPAGKNLYRLDMFFYLPPEVRRKKLMSGVYLSITEREAVKLQLRTQLWYRGERLVGFNTPRGFSLFDLQPKCFLRREGNRWVPTYGGGDVVFTTPSGVRVHLFLSFTRCEF